MAVVREVDVGPVDTFQTVLLLFPCEERLVEVVLQLLIGDVDAKLLEAILKVEVLEASEIEDGNLLCVQCAVIRVAERVVNRSNVYTRRFTLYIDCWLEVVFYILATTKVTRTDL